MAVCGSFSHRWPGVGPTQRRCLVGGLFFPFPPPSVRGCSSTCTFGANVVSRVLLTTWQQDDELTCLLGVTKICPLHGSRGGPSSLNWWVLFRLIQTMRSMRLVWLSATCLCAPSELVWKLFLHMLCCASCQADSGLFWGGRVFPSKKGWQEPKCVHPCLHNLTRFRMICYFEWAFASLTFTALPKNELPGLLASNSLIDLQNERSL